MTKIQIFKTKKIKDFLITNNQSLISSSGFTLIELLVVIAIISILISVSLVGFSQSRKSARDAKRKADLEQIRSALEIYRTDCKTYPTAISSGDSLEGEGICAGNIYMETVPTDPSSPTYEYRYTRISVNQYCLCAYLETQAASGTCACGGDCGSGSTECTYKVSSP